MGFSFDFNGDERQQNGFELIPPKTILPVVVNVRPGGAGDGGWLRQSQTSDAEMLDCEFTVEQGPFANRKIWQMFTVSGGKLDDHGESIGARISGQALRAMLESARNINPDDQSDAARAARCITGWGDFNGLRIWVKVGVEKDKTARYDDKNKIDLVLTPDMKDYGKISEAPAQNNVQAPWKQNGQAAASASWGGSQQGPQTSPQAASQPTQNATPTPAWAR